MYTIPKSLKAMSLEDLSLEARGEILKTFRSYFGRNDDLKILFWDLLTFTKVCTLENNTNLNLIFHSIKSTEIVLLFLPSFYLITLFMTSPKNTYKFSKYVWQLVFFRSVKTHFCELPQKWCIFRHGKNWFSQALPSNIYWTHYK